MRPLANIRHERFLREYMKTGVASEAYRRVYPGIRNPASAWVSASRLLRRDKVKRRLRTLQEHAMKRADITIEKILTNYQEAMDLAKGQGRAGDIIMAAKEQARLVGLLVERRELGQVGDFDSLSDPADVIDKVRAEVGEDAANALASAFGLEAPDTLLGLEGPADGESIN